LIQRGFAEAARKDDVEKRFDGVDKRLDAIEDHLESIEKLMLDDHRRRIERLEGEMRELRELFAIK
jgi:hypothetical protein